MPEDPSDQHAEPPFPANAVHLLRTTQLVHVQLSAMADHKASILMGATFVVFTLTIGQSRGTTLPLPMLLLGGFAFVAALLAVAAILPATRPRRGSAANLLFFGYFAQLPEEDYLDRTLTMLRHEADMYRAMARDIYHNGQVLQRKKYRLLGLAYRVFIVGLVASGVAFAWQYAADHSGTPAKTEHRG